MDILIGLVIAIFIVTAAYVGYHASQEPQADGHGIPVIPEILAETHAFQTEKTMVPVPSH